MHLFDLERMAARPSVEEPSYRCPGCGEEVAFNSLAASCRCSDECYGSARTERSVRL